MSRIRHPRGMRTLRLDARAMVGILAVAMIWMAAWSALQLWSSASLESRSTVAIAATIDATLTASLALYLIAVRSGRLPRWTIGVTISAGLVFARFCLGGAQIGMVASTLELGTFALVIWRGRRALRSWRAERARGARTLDALTTTFLATGLPATFSAVLATELTVFASVLGWWRRVRPSPSLFTVHRVNGWFLYAGVIGFLAIVETAVVHVALSAYASVTLAWVVTTVSIYGVLWILGDAVALRHGGVIVDGRGIELRIGVRWRGQIAWAKVESVELGSADDALNLSIMGANMIVRLRDPVTLLGLFGRKRTASTLGLSIDDPAAMLARCAHYCAAQPPSTFHAAPRT